MTTHNGGPPRAVDADQIFHAIASLETKIDALLGKQQSFGTELKTIVPRLDVLAVEVNQLGERIHRTNNLVTTLVDETGCLHQAQITMERALEIFELDMKARAIEMRRTQAAFDHALEVLEGRVRHMRDGLADIVSEEHTAVISSPNSSGHNG